MPKSVLVDVTRCVGCGSCAVACKLWNNLQYNNKPTEGKGAELSSDSWTVVKLVEAKKEQENVWRFVKQQCLHCHEPACASACFSKAIKKTKEGPVVYDAGLCVGCRYCMLACPFNIPKYEWDKAFPKVQKCQMCPGRIAGNEMPACVGVCPAGALAFGEHEEMIGLANQRISGGSNYIKQIYGEKEAGGASWLYISDIPFKDLGFRTDITTRPLPEYTDSILKLTPAVGLGWGAVLTGLYVYNRRRNEIVREENSKREK
ncbi:MAG: 4Fe-4S dicluster domain-containing protein [Bacillota bacterium]